MITDLKPYPAYQDTGVEWLGQIPSGWAVRRQSNLIELRISNVDKHKVDGERPVRLCNYVDVYRRDRIRADIPFSSGTALDSEVERFSLRRGDVLITKDSESWDDIASPALVECEAEDLVCGYHLAILRPRPELSGAYLFWASQSLPVASQYQVSASGVTRFGLTQGDIKRVEIPLPPLEDQTSIARFLDHVDSRIHRFISAKERLIKLVTEENQAIINRAVTRGLDPSVSLKPAGVDWLGDIPEHWNVRPLGRCLHGIEQGWSPVAAEGAISPGQWTVLTLSAVRTGCFDPGAVKPISMESQVRKDLVVRDGDLLMTRANTRSKVGDVCIVKHARPLTIISDLIYRLLVDSSRLDASFLMNQLLSPVGRLQIERDARGSSDTMPKITQRRMRAWKILVPPIWEQTQIVKAVEERLVTVSQAAVTTHRQMSLLREYRTRLISDVVTGKLDVREAAANLPDDPDADDPALDEALEEVAAG